MKMLYRPKTLVLLFLVLCTLLPMIGLAATALPEWQARAAEAFDLANEAGLANWQGSLPMLWTESDAIRRVLYLAPRVREDKLQRAYQLLSDIREQAGTDNRVFALLAAIEAYRGDRTALTDLARENAEGRQDCRFNSLDLALYLRDWDMAERLSRELEAEGVQWALTYRRAILAGLRGNVLMADSLWREAVSEGLPITQAAYKELYKAGLSSLVSPPALHSKVKGYLDTIDYSLQRSASITPSPAIIPDGLRNGITAYETGNFKEAIQYWQTVTSPADSRFIAQCMIGEAQNRLGRFDEALRFWDETVKSNPDFFLGYLGLAEAYKGKGSAQKAEACLQAGFRHSDSAFLLKNNAIDAGILKEIRGTIGPGNLAGHNMLTIPGVESGAADGFWISWNYGRDWLWYPNYLHPFLAPSGEEYWIKGTGGLQAQRFPDQILSQRSFAKVQAMGSPMVENTHCGETPTVRWEWNAPVALRFEYWRSGGARMTVEQPLQTLHTFTLDNTEPGQDYRYRAYATRDGQEIALVEGVFSTEAAPFWVGITRPDLFFGAKTQQAIISVQSTEPAVMSGQVRWAENEGSWSDWGPVKPQLVLNLTAKTELLTFQIQFRDRQGRVSPILRETVQTRIHKVFDGLTPVSLWINSGEEMTAERSVLLSLSQSGTKSEIRFSNDGSMWGPWNPVGESFHWRLSSGDGQKTVFAQVRDGDQIHAYHTTILLDSQTPDVTGITFDVTQDKQGMAVWNTSKPSRCRFYWGRNKDDLHLVEEEEYKTEHRAILGLIGDDPIIWRVEAQDRAGNLAVRTDGWLTGQSGKYPVPVVNWGSPQTIGGFQNVILQFQAVGPSPLAMRLRNREGSWTAWLPFQPQLTWSLMPFSGQQWVDAQFKDGNGMVTPISSVRFALELRPPRVYGIEVQTGPDGIRYSWKTDKRAKAWLLVQSQSETGFKDYAVFPGTESALMGTITPGKLPQGIYRMRLMVEDQAGDWNSSAWDDYEEY